MSQTVACPSGIVLELERPKLRRLLASAPVDMLALADACMDSALCPASGLLEEDCYYVACWAIEELVEDPEADGFTSVCEHYSEAPSVRLGMSDQVLAYELDYALTAHAMAEDASDERGGGVAPDDPDLGFPRKDLE